VTEFYAALLGDATLSKAKALQRAQLSILNDERYSHPCYWAPFLVIGNWL
jgi:CHAT domain-containing protein